MLQLLKNLRSFSQGKEITDAIILDWANKKVKSSGKSSQMESFKVHILPFFPLYQINDKLLDIQPGGIDLLLVNRFFFRIKVYLVGYSSWNFLVLWNQE